MHALVLAALLFSPSPVLAQESRDTFVAEATASAAADVVPTGDDGAARMTVPVMVNGQGPFSFVIDTGADRTVISRELAERLALRKAGNVRLHAMGGSGRVDVVKVDHLQISPRVSRRLEAAALPRQYIGADGLLGLDSLKGQRIIMDFRAGTMTLEPATQRERDVDPASDVIVVTARSRLGQLVMVDADANGQKVWVVVDTGAQNSVGNLRLKRLMLARDPRTTTRPIEMIDVLGQRTPAGYTIVNRLRIGGVLMGNAAIAFADAHPFRLFDLHNKPSMLMGMESLKSFDRVSVDFMARKITFLLPSGAPRAAAGQSAGGATGAGRP